MSIQENRYFMVFEAGNELFPCNCYTPLRAHGEKLSTKSFSLLPPYKYRSHHSCADTAEGAINLIADYFSAAPRARQRRGCQGSLGRGRCDSCLTADGFAWLVPKSWRKSALPMWRSWDQKRDVTILDTQCQATKTLAVSANVSGTGILPLFPPQTGKDVY